MACAYPAQSRPTSPGYPFQVLAPFHSAVGFSLLSLTQKRKRIEGHQQYSPYSKE